MQTDVNPASRASDALYEAAPVRRAEHQENWLTRVIEQQTAKVPSAYFLFAAILSMAASVGLELAGKDRLGQFVGKWPGPLLTMGLYNKMVKLHGAH